MPQQLNLDGLPLAVANAIVETVAHLKNQYKAAHQKEAGIRPELPSRPGKVIGSLRREDLYDER